MDLLHHAINLPPLRVQLVTLQTVNVFAEQLVQPLILAWFLEKHVSLMFVNVERPHIVTRRPKILLLRQLHVTPKIMYVFAEPLEQTLVHVRFLEKHVQAMNVSVEQQVLAWEAQPLQLATAATTCVCAVLILLARTRVLHLNAMKVIMEERVFVERLPKVAQWQTKNVCQERACVDPIQPAKVRVEHQHVMPRQWSVNAEVVQHAPQLRLQHVMQVLAHADVQLIQHVLLVLEWKFVKNQAVLA